MKKLIVVMLLSLLLVNLVHADMIMYGYKPVSYCFTIENQADYEAYYFLYAGGVMALGEVINEGECTSFYKHSQPFIVAISSEDFSLEEINEILDNEEELFIDNIGLEEAFDNKILKSDLSLNVYGSVDENNPLAGAQEVLSIVELGEDHFEIVKDYVIYTYEDGSSEELSFNGSDEFPTPSKNLYLPWWGDEALIAVGILIALIALITMVVILIKRRK